MWFPVPEFRARFRDKAEVVAGGIGRRAVAGSHIVIDAGHGKTVRLERFNGLRVDGRFRPFHRDEADAGQARLLRHLLRDVQQLMRSMRPEIAAACCRAARSRRPAWPSMR